MDAEAERSEAELKSLWQPLSLRALSLPNRVMCSATTLQYAEEGLISERHLAFYRERAAGGVGLLFSEQLTATSLSPTAFPNQILAYDERQVERFAQLSAALAPFQTRFFAQLVAGGAEGSSTLGIDGWAPLRGPSQVAAPGGESPVALSEGEIDQVVADHVRSARNVRLGGLHGLEVHGAHGWLVGQFLSPFYNRRTDRYGGDLEGRCRLAIEIGRAIRAEVGDRFPVGLTLTYDEAIGEAGITPQDTLAQLELLAAAGVYDFFDLSIGAPHSVHLTISSMSVPEGYALPFASKAKEVVGSRAAIFVAGRITDPRLAAQAVADGMADVVAMTRAHLADPHLTAKAREGRLAQATRCVGSNHCVGRALSAEPVTCVLNPVTGREGRWGAGSLTPVRQSRSVVVVGAGPAGLRAASTAAQRGHAVVVHERRQQAGGHIRDLAWLPTRQSWMRAIDDLTGSIERAGGQLRLGSELDADALAGGGADVVLVATGAAWEASGASPLRPDRDAIPGAAAGHVIDLGSALSRAERDVRALGERVLIADETGTYAPLGLAEALAGAGVAVEVLTPAGSIGQSAAVRLELPHILPRLGRLGVTLTVCHDIAAIDGERVMLRDVWSGEQLPRSFDTVVLAMRRAPRAELAAALSQMPADVRLIGDALSPRPTAAVIHEAERVAREL